MDIMQLKQELCQGNVRNSYVFCGDELALQDIYIDKIKEISKLSVVRVEYLKDVYKKLGVRSLTKTRKIYIIRNDEDYKKSEGVWERVIAGTNQKDNIIILLYSNLDKRSKFYKQHQPILTEFTFVGTDLLAKRVHALCKLPLNHCEHLVRLCGNNYGRIKLELTKLQILTQINGYDITTAFLTALEYNMIHEELGDVTFDFGNAVCVRNTKLAYYYKEKLDQMGESPTKLLGVLYNGFRCMLMVQCTPPNMQDETVLGLSKGVIWNTKQKLGHYSNVELTNALKCIRYAEKGIKLGEVESNIALDFVLAQIL